MSLVVASVFRSGQEPAAEKTVAAKLQGVPAGNRIGQRHTHLECARPRSGLFTVSLLCQKQCRHLIDLFSVEAVQPRIVGEPLHGFLIHMRSI